MATRDDLFRYAQNLYALDNLGEAAGIYTALAAMNPQDHDVLQQLAHLRREQGTYDKAETLFKRLSQKPASKVSATAGLALTYFQMERFEEAWNAFEIRFNMMDKPPVVTKTVNGTTIELPKWDGKTNPKSLLVMAEQGLGDTLQFAQFLVPLVKAGIKAVVVAPKRLHALLRTLPVPLDLKPLEERGSVNASHWIPMMGLPHALKLHAKEYRVHQPYFSTSPERRAFWRHIMGTEGVKIGIIWQGNPDPSIDTGRSVPLEIYKPLLTIPHVKLFSLQKGFGEEQLQTCSFRNRIQTLENVDSGDDGFLDTAAIMQNCDYIVSSCTSAAHLAGALHVKTKLLLKKYGTDWRWLARKRDSIWYPQHSLYRQTINGQWEGAMAQITQDISSESTLPFMFAPPTMPASPHDNQGKAGHRQAT